VDILNPIQTSAGKNGQSARPEETLCRPDRILRAIDTQKILPFGTPEQVRQEVRRVINISRAERGLHGCIGAYHHE